MWLSPWKSTQRCSEPSFFLTNKTGAPCRDEVGQIKPVLRFSSMNSFRASCSDAEREYIGPTGGWASSSKLILRSYGRWEGRVSALVLLKMLANLWYSGGILERSGVSASFVELAWMFKGWRQSLKLWEPRSFDICKNAAVPMIAMLGCSELNTEVSDTDMRLWSLMIAEKCPKRTEMPIVCWPQREKKQDFPAKMDGSLSTYLPSQSVDCVGWSSCIQGPKSRKNQAEWHRSPDSYNH